MLAGADAAGVNLAALTGENAAKNNALFMLAISYLITAISIRITAYEIHDLYVDIEKAGGDEAAAREVLAQTGAHVSASRPQALAALPC
tara:strand:+ start:11359 stop:11625 length:267 start_codon:yes stop_codon:yes gene_type:complete